MRPSPLGSVCRMRFRLLPWQPDYGSAVQFAAEPKDGAEDVPLAVLGAENRAWAPVTPNVEAPIAVIVDGVRRTDAIVLSAEPGRGSVFGLFGTFAVGAVRCDGVARVLHEHTRVQRTFFYTGSSSEIPDRFMRSGSAQLAYQSESREDAASASDLQNALHSAMRFAEARLSESLSEDESVLTLVDGPLRSLRSPGRHTVGFIKRQHQMYLSTEEQELLWTLDVGERTPLFEIPAAAGKGYATDRLSWFVRLARIGTAFHPHGELMRLEATPGIPPSEAVALADQSAKILPRLASSPIRDPRAPQNLTPVGALENHLTHLMGDRRLIHRMLAASLALDTD